MGSAPTVRSGVRHVEPCPLRGAAAAVAGLERPDTLLPRINGLWQTAVPVEIDLDGVLLIGRFEGIDAQGRLQLVLAGGETKILEPYEVRLFREIP